MNLDAHQILVDQLEDAQIRRMLCLMQAHYENVTEEQFRADLAEKDCAILLENEHAIQGFSTQAISQLVVDEEPVRVVFSGDTVIDRRHWGTPALPIAWGRFMLGLLEKSPEIPLFWLLTSKGYKTYRYLPMFFDEYYPHPLRQPTDFIRVLVHTFCGEMFGPRFDEQSWTVQAGVNGQRLRPGIAEITPARRRNCSVRFFEERNPRHAAGDELVCLAPFHPRNLSSLIRRWLAVP